MKILIQWAKNTAENWQQYDHTEWPDLINQFKKEDPTNSGNPLIDNDPGWINAINIQGVVFNADHYVVESLVGSGVKVTIINDDPDDNPTGFLNAEVWNFPPLSPDPNLGNAINTKQTSILYAEDSLIQTKHLNVDYESKTLLPWKDFKKPRQNITIHGIQLSDAKFNEHQRKRSLRGWREWTEHLDPSQLNASGILLSQRSLGLYSVPKGTKTFFATDNLSPPTLACFHNPPILWRQLINDPITESTTVVSVAIDTVIAREMITGSGQPNNLVWPSGEYRHQIDVTVAAAQIDYGIKNQFAGINSTSGHFGRVDTERIGHTPSGGKSTSQQIEGIFNGTGLKLATTQVAWGDGLATDRFGIRITMKNTTTMGPSRDITFELNGSDDFADGPWPADAAPSAARIIQNPIFQFAL